MNLAIKYPIGAAAITLGRKSIRFFTSEEKNGIPIFSLKSRISRRLFTMRIVNIMSLDIPSFGYMLEPR